MKQRYIVSGLHQAVVVLVPKVATRTLLDVFVRNPEEDYGCQWVQATEFQDEWRDYRTVMFTRNPSDRFLSFYVNKIVDPHPNVVEKLLKPNHLRPNMTVDEVLDFISRQKDKEMEEHWRPQYTFVPQVNGMSIGHAKIESGFGRILKGFMRERGMIRTKPIPFVNKSKRKPVILTPDQMARIKQKYQKDYRIFEY